MKILPNTEVSTKNAPDPEYERNAGHWWVIMKESKYFNVPGPINSWFWTDVNDGPEMREFIDWNQTDCTKVVTDTEWMQSVWWWLQICTYLKCAQRWIVSTKTNKLCSRKCSVEDEEQHQKRLQEQTKMTNFLELETKLTNTLLSVMV